MRVVMVAPWGSARCGLRTYAKYLAEELSRHVELWVVPHYRYAQPDKQYARWLARRVNGLKPDIVHVMHEYGIWNPWDPSVFLEFLRLVEGRKIITMHSTGFPVEEAVSRLVDAVIVHNRHIFGSFQGDRGKCFIIPHGCKLINMSRDAARRRLAIKPSTYLIGVFGFIDSRKGHDVALEAFSRLRKSGVDAEMVFVGGWHSGNPTPYMLDIVGRAGELGVKVTGYVDDRVFEYWMAAVDVVLHPARIASESGIVSLALGAGKPVITSSHPAFYGKPVIRAGSINELVGALKRLANPEVRAKWSRYARRYAELFNWERIAWLHHHLYKWILYGDRESLIQLNGVRDAHWQLIEHDLHGSIEAIRDPIHKPRHEWIRRRMKHPCIDIGSSFGYMGCEVNVDIAYYRAKIGELLYPDRKFIIADAHKLPFKNGGFKQALLCEVLEHVENPLTVLREASRIAEEIIITVPDEHPPYTPSHSTEHLRFFTKESLTKLIEKAGLEIVEYEHIVNKELNYAWHCLVARGR